MKLRLLYIFLLSTLSLSAFSQVKIGPDGGMHSTGPGYAPGWNSELKGGPRAYQSIAERNAIRPAFREVNMLIYVRDSSAFYTLDGGIDNTDWVKVGTILSSLQDLRSVTHVGPVTDTSIYIRGQGYNGIYITDTTTNIYSWLGINPSGNPELQLGNGISIGRIGADNLTGDRLFSLPDTSGIGTVGAKLNGVIYPTGLNGIIDLGLLQFSGDSTIIDSAGITFFVDSTVNTSPTIHASGQVVLIGSNPTGIFATRSNNIATWDADNSVWTYQAPPFDNGTYLSDANQNNPHLAQWNGTTWVGRVTYLPNGGFKIKQPWVEGPKDKYPLIFQTNNKEVGRFTQSGTFLLSYLKGVPANSYLAPDTTNGGVIWKPLSPFKVTHIGSNFYYDGDSLNIPVSSGGGSGGVESVTGDIVDNTDPLNPIINTPTLQQVHDAGNIVSDEDGNTVTFNAAKSTWRGTDDNGETYTQIAPSGLFGLSIGTGKNFSLDYTGLVLPVYSDADRNAYIGSNASDNLIIFNSTRNRFEYWKDGTSWEPLAGSGTTPTWEQTLQEQGSTSFTTDNTVNFGGHSLEFDNLSNLFTYYQNIPDNQSGSFKVGSNIFSFDGGDADGNYAYSLFSSDSTIHIQSLGFNNISHSIDLTPQYFKINKNGTDTSKVTLIANVDSSNADPNNVAWFDENNILHRGHLNISGGGSTPSLQAVTDVGYTTNHSMVSYGSGVQSIGTFGSSGLDGISIAYNLPGATSKPALRYNKSGSILGDLLADSVTNVGNSTPNRLWQLPDGSGNLTLGVTNGTTTKFANRSGIVDISSLLTGGSGSTNSNIGTGYRLAVPSTNNIKTLFAGTNIDIDSTSNTNGLTINSQVYSANEGVSVSSNNFSLGGTITGIRVLSGSLGFQLIDISNSSTGPALNLTGGGTTSAALEVQGNNNTTSTVARFRTQPSTGNASVDVIELKNNPLTGSGGTSVGSAMSILFKQRIGPATPFDGNRITSTLTNTNGTTSLSFLTSNATTIGTVMTLNGTGSATLNKYGIGTFTGTDAYSLSVNSSGNIIETQPITKTTTATASGNGSSTSINITLPASATWVMVGAANAASAGITYWTVSGNTLTINYTVAPMTGTNNLSYWISYK